ncbi:polyprenyl synthetase family protein [Vagococcus lutrae]|uniref:Polyprenyl synthetase family protein n=1 Tax=Vagococcus lutrae TaxID=81947 RepID=A0AAF0BCU7_9ENTE|nr:polyprenyl synthetase family protein [Vagococcus lutrae]WCG23058.1 polyprenyl synthetase family protein [Vagococcus lutrae]
MIIHPLWNEYPQLQKELKQTLTIMQQSVNLANKEVEAAILTMMHSGGKMLRPAYLLLFSYYGKETDRQKMMALAASVETLHTATLIHDDIVDEAATRRSHPSIQATFGKDVAVYAGDYLFVSCFKILARYASDLKSMELNIDSMDRILSGEIGQMDTRYQTDLPIETYLDNIAGKTGELFSLACFLGAFEGQASKTVAKKAKDIGLNVGMAFQIMDDILDYSETETQLGKPVLEDVKQGVYSLPLLCAIQENPTEILPLLYKKEQLTEQETNELYQLVHTSNGVSQAKQYAEKYTTVALKSLKSLRSINPEVTDMIYRLTEHLLKRTQ